MRNVLFPKCCLGLPDQLIRDHLIDFFIENFVQEGSSAKHQRVVESRDVSAEQSNWSIIWNLSYCASPSRMRCLLRSLLIGRSLQPSMGTSVVSINFTGTLFNSWNSMWVPFAHKASPVSSDSVHSGWWVIQQNFLSSHCMSSASNAENFFIINSSLSCCK